MCRVENVEQPFHALSFSKLSVVAAKEWHCKQYAKLAKHRQYCNDFKLVCIK